MNNIDNIKIAVIGLGYVGLPLARLFATKFPVVGIDINSRRVNELRAGNDTTLEVDKELLISVLINDNPAETNQIGLYVSDKLEDVKNCNFYIVTVPTPIDQDNNPDITTLKFATRSVSAVLKKDDIVVYESTVFPGATENICIPLLQLDSKLICNTDFYVGYSPERVNPGDSIHTIDKVIKITSGSNPEAAKLIDDVYRKVITIGTYLAPSIKVAEAAKITENIQRDVNIALMNELAIVYRAMGINIYDVINAAGTKWNFLKFTPGLVGGHCIGVDPYYLIEEAKKYGVRPDFISDARKVNEGFPKYVAVKMLVNRKYGNTTTIKILILGFTFKENCTDIRNTKVVDICNQLNKLGVYDIDIYDPWVNKEQAKTEYDIDIINNISELGKYDIITLAVAHNEFLTIDLNQFKKDDKSIIYDIKGVVDDSYNAFIL
jgi:UDP-N-acetyl-D-galactosamine dehydrogenase